MRQTVCERTHAHVQTMMVRLLEAIQAHVKTRDGRKIRLCIEEIRSELDFDMASTSQVHAALYMLQEAVSWRRGDE